jgi:hypothetical protein
MRFFRIVVTAAIISWGIIAPQASDAQTTVLNTSGALTTSSPTGPPRGTTFYQQTFPVTFTAGNQYTIDMMGANGVNADTYLYLLGPGGAIVAENDDVTMYYVLRSRIAYDCTQGGQYTIVCTSWAPYTTFNFTLTVVSAPIVTAPINGTLTTSSPQNSPSGAGYYANTNDLGTLTGGQTYTIDLIGQNGDYNYNVDTMLYIVNAAGQVVASDNDYGQGYSSRVVYTVPTNATGDYKAIVTSFAPGVVFSYQITVTGSNAPPPPPPVPTPNGGGIPNVLIAPRMQDPAFIAAPLG